MKVLFVCLGNICRSPMAEAMFKNLVLRESLNIEVDSAGTSGWHDGKIPHHGTLSVLDSLNIDYDGMRSRKLILEDFETYDCLIGMDQENVKDMLEIAPESLKHKVYLFLGVLPQLNIKNVPDPWYTKDFEQTKHLVLSGSKAWLDKIKGDFR